MHETPAIAGLTIGSHAPSECRMVVGEIRRQTIAPRIEMILVSPTREGFPQQETPGFRDFVWVNRDDVSSFGEAMAAAVRAARAPWVVYAEEHSYFDEHWAERLVAALEAGHPLVGFAIENANPGTLMSWAHLYGQFGPAVAPVATGETPMLTGHHVSHSRELLPDHGDQMAALLDDESALFLGQQAKGLRFHVQGDASSRHVNISSITHNPVSALARLVVVQRLRLRQSTPRPRSPPWGDFGRMLSGGGDGDGLTTRQARADTGFWAIRGGATGVQLDFSAPTRCFAMVIE